MVKSGVSLMVVVMVVVVTVRTLPAEAAVVQGGSAGGPREQLVKELGSMSSDARHAYLDVLKPELVTLLRHLPEMHDIRIIEGPRGPRLDMPLSGCRDSLDCHHRFTNYLGLLVRMMETGKKRRK